MPQHAPGARRLHPVHASVRALCAITLFAACERGTRTPQSGATAAATPAPAPAAPGAVASGWNAALGPVLLVQGTSPSDAQVVLAVSTNAADTITEQQAVAVRSQPAILLGHGDSMQVAILQAQLPRSGKECVPWPTWEVDPAQAGAALRPWMIGFVAAKTARLEPIPLDSVESLSRGDSAHLAAEVTRLASAVPNGSGASRFQGLPFTVLSMWRFRAAPAVEGVATTLVRRLNQEAQPLEERTFLIAERDSTRRDAPYELAFHERSSGAEETIETTDVVAGVHVTSTSEPTLVLSRDYGDGTAFAFVQRDSASHWRVRWSSRRAKC